MSEGLNFEKVWAALMETREQMKESRERADREMEELRRAMIETDKYIKKASKQLGKIGNNNGAMAESYFFNSLNKTKMFGKEKFDYAAKNIKWRTRELQDEYDIVLYNGTSIGIIEVKYSAEKKDIAQTISKATTFRQLFPTYKDLTFYLGLASLSFEKDVEETAIDAGVAVIKQVGDVVVAQDERVKKF